MKARGLSSKTAWRPPPLDDGPPVGRRRLTAHPPSVASMRMRASLPPMLWENALHIRDPTLLGYPLFGVEAIFVAGLLRLVYGH
jgi:hypothetical protein